MRIDVSSHVPVYLQIVEGVRHAIVRGVHRTGEALPSVRELGVKLGVNPNTERRSARTRTRDAKPDGNKS